MKKKLPWLVLIIIIILVVPFAAAPQKEDEPAEKDPKPDVKIPPPPDPDDKEANLKWVAENKGQINAKNPIHANAVRVAMKASRNVQANQMLDLNSDATLRRLVAQVLEIRAGQGDAPLANDLIRSLILPVSTAGGSFKASLDKGIDSGNIAFKVLADGTIVVIDGLGKERDLSKLKSSNILGILSDDKGVLTYQFKEANIVAKFGFDVRTDGTKTYLVPEKGDPILLKERKGDAQLEQEMKQTIEVSQTDKGVKASSSTGAEFLMGHVDISLRKGGYFERTERGYKLERGNAEGNNFLLIYVDSGGVIRNRKQDFLIVGTGTIEMSPDGSVKQVILERHDNKLSYAIINDNGNEGFKSIHLSTTIGNRVFFCADCSQTDNRAAYSGTIMVQDGKTSIAGVAYVRVNNEFSHEGRDVNMLATYKSQNPDLQGNNFGISEITCAGCPADKVVGVQTANGRYAEIRTKSVGNIIKLEYVYSGSVGGTYLDAYHYSMANQKGEAYADFNIVERLDGTIRDSKLNSQFHQFLLKIDSMANFENNLKTVLVLDRTVPLMIDNTLKFVERAYVITKEGRLIVEPLDVLRSGALAPLFLYEAVSKATGSLDTAGIRGNERMARLQEISVIFQNEALMREKAYLASAIAESADPKVFNLVHDLDEAKWLLTIYQGRVAGGAELSRRVAMGETIEEAAKNSELVRKILSDPEIAYKVNSDRLVSARAMEAYSVRLFDRESQQFKTVDLKEKSIDQIYREETLKTVASLHSGKEDTFRDLDAASRVLFSFVKSNLPEPERVSLEKIFDFGLQGLSPDSYSKLLQSGIGPNPEEPAFLAPLESVTKYAQGGWINGVYILPGGNVVITDPNILRRLQNGELKESDLVLAYQLKTEAEAEQKLKPLLRTAEILGGADSYAEVVLTLVGAVKPVLVLSKVSGTVIGAAMVSIGARSSELMLARESSVLLETPKAFEILGTASTASQKDALSVLSSVFAQTKNPSHEVAVLSEWGLRQRLESQGISLATYARLRSEELAAGAEVPQGIYSYLITNRFRLPVGVEIDAQSKTGLLRHGNEWDPRQSLFRVEGKQIDASLWASTSSDTRIKNIVAHFNEHGKEIGVTNAASYNYHAEEMWLKVHDASLRDAKFIAVDEGIMRAKVDSTHGVVTVDVRPDGTVKYRLNDQYIILKDEKILSFGGRDSEYAALLKELEETIPSGLKENSKVSSAPAELTGISDPKTLHLEKTIFGLAKALDRETYPTYVRDLIKTDLPEVAIEVLDRSRIAERLEAKGIDIRSLLWLRQEEIASGVKIPKEYYDLLIDRRYSIPEKVTVNSNGKLEKYGVEWSPYNLYKAPDGSTVDGSFWYNRIDMPTDTISYHFTKHGAGVLADSQGEYAAMAETVREAVLRNQMKGQMSATAPDVRKYYWNTEGITYFIMLDKDKKIRSFGKQTPLQ